MLVFFLPRLGAGGPSCSNFMATTAETSAVVTRAFMWPDIRAVDSFICSSQAQTCQGTVGGLKHLPMLQGLLFYLFKEVSKSVQVLFNGTEAVMVLTLIFLKCEPCIVVTCGCSMIASK